MKPNTKFLLTVLIITCCFVLPTSSYAQYNQWTWMAGDNTTNQPGVYGTQGVGAPTNKPGARYEGGGEWVDLQGNFWHFGGGYPTSGNDLWKYDPVIDQWTWMKGSTTTGAPDVYGTLGVANIANTPGATDRASATCVDLLGNFWMFGGNNGTDRRDALWKYDPVTNMWTWMSGTQLVGQPGVYGTKGIPSAANKPGARQETDAMWADASGNIWMFGGEGYDGVGGLGTLNDLWKFDPITGEWTWMSGSNLIGQTGVYGSQGVSSPANIPGGRWVYAAWKDLAGNFWIFGGGELPPGNLFDDLWKYDPVINEWTWIKGNAGTGNINGTYGTKCLDAPANNPDAVVENRARWEDDCGNFWLWGGFENFMDPFFLDMRNALWRYSHVTNNWTWVSGSNTINGVGVYGTKGVSSAANVPDSRGGALPFRKPNTNELWLFGGGGGGFPAYNDMWRFVPDKPTAAFTFTPNNACAPSTVCFTNASTPGCNEIKSYLWNFGDPGSGANNISILSDPCHIFNTDGTYTVQVVVTNCTASKDSITHVVTVKNCGCSVTATTSSTPENCGAGNGSATVTVTTGSSPYTYTWSNGTTTTTSSPNHSITSLLANTYTVTVTDASGCTSVKTVSVANVSTLAATSGATPACPEVGGSAFVNPTGGTSPYTYTWSSIGITSATVSGLANGTYTVTITDAVLCSITKTITVTNYTSPIASAGPDATITSGSSITLNGSGGTTYLWSPPGTLSCTNCSTPVATPISTTTYTLLVTDANGCKSTDEVTLFIEIKCNGAEIIFIPTAFSPNNDGQNDVFTLRAAGGNCLKEFTFIVFNRWGEKVFETTDITKGWDGNFKGNPANTGVYVYTLTATTTLNEKVTKKGNVTLIK